METGQITIRVSGFQTRAQSVSITSPRTFNKSSGVGNIWLSFSSQKSPRKSMGKNSKQAVKLAVHPSVRIEEWQRLILIISHSGVYPTYQYQGQWIRFPKHMWSLIYFKDTIKENYSHTQCWKKTLWKKNSNEKILSDQGSLATGKKGPPLSPWSNWRWHSACFLAPHFLAWLPLSMRFTLGFSVKKPAENKKKLAE